MPSIRQIYPDTYLKPDHLQGRTCKVTIERVYIDKFWNPRVNEKQPALVLKMKRKKLPFILNKTQAFGIAAILGAEDYSAWQGGTICLKEGLTLNGKPTIVVLAPEATEPPPAAAEPHPDAESGNEVHPDADEQETHPDVEGEPEAAQPTAEV